MSTYSVSTSPVEIRETGQLSLVNNGPNTIYLDTSVGVLSPSQSFPLHPFGVTSYQTDTPLWAKTVGIQSQPQDFASQLIVNPAGVPPFASGPNAWQLSRNYAYPRGGDLSGGTYTIYGVDCSAYETLLVRLTCNQPAPNGNPPNVMTVRADWKASVQDALVASSNGYVAEITPYDVATDLETWIPNGSNPGTPVHFVYFRIPVKGAACNLYFNEIVQTSNHATNVESLSVAGSQQVLTKSMWALDLGSYNNPYVNSSVGGTIYSSPDGWAIASMPNTGYPSGLYIPTLGDTLTLTIRTDPPGGSGSLRVFDRRGGIHGSVDLNAGGVTVTNLTVETPGRALLVATDPPPSYLEITARYS